MDSQIEIKRETEFYQGFIRLKMSVSNKISFVIIDVTLEFFYEYGQFQIDHYEPHYKIKNNKVLMGNINGGTSKSIAVYFDPLMCTRSAEINCQVNFMDSHGKRSSVFMEPKLISVVCPVIKTEFDINVGRLKEFIEELPRKDSKIYEIDHDLKINKIVSIAREILEKHDVRHVRTLKTKDGRECEIWYYGRTKVTRSDIVIRISISSEKHLLELFAATESAEALTGLLAELGRDLKYNIETRATGKGNIVNITIRESVIQRSNLLDLCSLDGTCPVDILVEDSIVQHTNLISGKDENEEEKKIRKEEEKHDKLSKQQEDEACLRKAEEERLHRQREEELKQSDSGKQEKRQQEEFSKQREEERKKKETEARERKQREEQERKRRDEEKARELEEQEKLGKQKEEVEKAQEIEQSVPYTYKKEVPSKKFASLYQEKILSYCIILLVLTILVLGLSFGSHYIYYVPIINNTTPAENVSINSSNVDLDNQSLAFNTVGRYKEAIQASDRAIEIDPIDTDAWYNKGYALSHLGRYDEAIQAYDKALEIEPNYAWAWYSKGRTLETLGRYDEAIQAYDKALEIEPNDTSFLDSKGYSLNVLGRYTEAIQVCNRSIEITPENTIAWDNKGYALKGLGRYKEAIQAYDKAIEIYSNDTSAWVQKGDTLYELGGFEESIQAYDKALGIETNDTYTWDRKGHALYSLGRYEEATVCFNKAAELDRTN